MRSEYFGEENFLHWRDPKPRTVHPIAYTDYASRGLYVFFWYTLSFLVVAVVVVFNLQH